MNENLRLKIKGDVRITLGDKTYEIENAVQYTALDIIRRCLGVGSPRISLIRVLNGSTILADSSVPTSSVTFTSIDGSVKFSTLFSENSFSGFFDGLELRAPYPLGTPGGSSADIFSKISGITPIEKTSDNQMIIEWVLTIELI